MRKDNKILVALFLIPIYLLAMINFFWPTQLISLQENRALSQKPVFSLASLVSGKYTTEFESFFSDQFPFRDFFIDIHHKAVNLLQSPLTGDVEVVTRPSQDLGTGETLEHDPSDIVINPIPTPIITESESDTTSATSSQPVETTAPALPTVPEITLPPVEGEVEDYSAVIIVNGYAMELYYYSAEKSTYYADLVSRLQSKVPGVRIIDMIAPTSVEFNSPAKYHSNSSSQKMAIDETYAKLSDGILTVDAYGKIVPHYGEYLYFRTDHHWTARGAYYAYTAFCESAGLQPVAIENMEQGFIEGDFLGTLYKYTNSEQLTENPDHVEYFLPTVGSEGIAYATAEMTEGYKVSAVKTDIKNSNKYLAFIGGDNPLTHFKTALTNGKSILVLKESYANCFVPFLINHYENVYVIDPRSLKCNLPDFISKNNIQDVLVLNYAFSITNQTWIRGFEAMIG